jgi:hypothetical protein
MRRGARNPDMYLRNRDSTAVWEMERHEDPRQRADKYRSEGGAADLARVEMRVPPSARHEILAAVSRLRAQHRANKELRPICKKAA